MPICGIFTPYEIDRFKKALEYIQLHYRNSCSAEQLSAEIGMDTKLVRAGIFYLTGLTVHSYLSEIRIERAKEDLADFKHSLKFIANKHGYSSHSHFSWQFKKHTGQTPTQYRLNMISVSV